MAYDDYDDYDDFLDEYNDQLDYLADQEEDAYDMYEAQVDEIDDYWDRENEYIRNSGIYTDEEVQQILANHEEIRRSKKKEARKMYEFEKESIRLDREQAAFEREMAAYDREYESLLEEQGVDGQVAEPVRIIPSYYEPQQRPSLLKRLMAFGGAYILFERIFFPKN